MKSVGNIAKITKAMKMVAASRLRGVQTRMEQSRGLPQPFVKLLGDAPGACRAGPFSVGLLSLVSGSPPSGPRFASPRGALPSSALTERAPSGAVSATTLVIPITSDKGLCGGINTTVVKYTKIVDEIAADAGSTSTLFLVGEKGRAQLARGATAAKVGNVVVDTAKSKEGMSFVMASMVADEILKGPGFEKVQIIFNRFQSVIAFKPTVATLLSTATMDAAAEEGGMIPFDAYEVEGPDRGEFLLDLGEFQLAATLYNAMLENSTSELGSRMQSMENSTKNAQEMLHKLTLYYNRTRQAAITTELIEIISGAAALEG